MKEISLQDKRGVYINLADYLTQEKYRLADQDKSELEKLDIAYRALCALLYNFAPSSGHPGGSISSGRLVSMLVYKMMAYDFSAPRRREADILSYAAGHKALGLYAMWALRDECVRIAQPDLLAAKEEDRLRLEDLLGFRRNRAAGTSLFKRFNVKPLGGHPEPATPFVWTCTGASGVGVASAVGLGLAAADAYGRNCPTVNILEGEGGLTAGRAGEALAAAATAQLKNVVLHIDWNQASIESENVTAEGTRPGDYVQWTPAQFLRVHDFNVIEVPDGHDFAQIYAAQKLVLELPNQQPTAIVYRTVKGWHYGLEGKASHGSGHKFCSPEFYQTLAEFEDAFGVQFPRFEGSADDAEATEEAFWQALCVLRAGLTREKATAVYVAQKVRERKADLRFFAREVRADLGNVQRLYHDFLPENVPAQFIFEPGKKYSTRSVLADELAYLNKETGGTIFTASADLYSSTNAGQIAKDFPAGFYNTLSNPQSREISAGGICEDGMAGICSGISMYGEHVGVWSSYAAFVAMSHVSARLHAIGFQSAKEIGQFSNTLILFNGHAGLPTGQDGPTHADPQALQLLQDNFPKGLSITLTPLEVDEIWPLLTAALSFRPALLSPFVTRTSQSFIDRNALELPPALAAAKGAYVLYRPKDDANIRGAVFVQGSGVGRIFVDQVLPVIKEQQAPLAVVYITSRELFEQLSAEEQTTLVPPKWKRIGTAITDFTLPTMDCWLHSDAGRACALWPHKNGLYPGSAPAAKVYEEAGMDAAGQLFALQEYLQRRERGGWQ